MNNPNTQPTTPENQTPLDEEQLRMALFAGHAALPVVNIHESQSDAEATHTEVPENLRPRSSRSLPNYGVPRLTYEIPEHIKNQSK
jgi:hypothetical protein